MKQTDYPNAVYTLSESCTRVRVCTLLELCEDARLGQIAYDALEARETPTIGDWTFYAASTEDAVSDARLELGRPHTRPSQSHRRKVAKAVLKAWGDKFPVPAHTYALSRIHGFPVGGSRDWACLATPHPDYLASKSDIIVTLPGDSDDSVTAMETLGILDSRDPIVIGDGLYAVAALVRDANLVVVGGWTAMRREDLIDSGDMDQGYLVGAVRAVYGKDIAALQLMALMAPTLPDILAACKAATAERSIALRGEQIAIDAVTAYHADRVAAANAGYAAAFAALAEFESRKV